MKWQALSKPNIAAKQFVGLPASNCTACVIENNRMAAEYLAGILGQDSRIDVRFFDQFVNSGAHESPLVFCLDQADAFLPLRTSLKLLKLSYPDSRCILLDAQSSSEHLGLLLDWGIHGFLTHANVKEWLREAVWSVANGVMWVHPEFANNVSPKGQQVPPCIGCESLTRREKEILHLVTNHFSNKEISSLLEIEESTVKFHLSNIFAKRNVSRREDLTTSRISEGWRTLLLSETAASNPPLRSLLR